MKSSSLTEIKPLLNYGTQISLVFQWLLAGNVGCDKSFGRETTKGK